MAEIVLARHDIAAIEAAIDDLDPSTHELLVSQRVLLGESDWEFAVTYIRQRIRSALELEMMARCLADKAVALNLCDRRGAEHFLRSKSWTHNFSVSQTTDEYFAALSSAHEGRLGRALDALILIAKDQMFGTLDEEYERLLNPR